MKAGGTLAGACILGLTGCGSAGRTGEFLGLSVTGTDDARKKYFAELADAFAEESGHWIEPVYVGIEQSRQKLTTQVGAGYPPDTAYYHTCLEKSDGGGLYRFLSLDGGFTADLLVDADGLVLDYPGLFRRVLP